MLRYAGNKSETVMAGKWLPWASKPPQNGKSYCFLMATWPSIKGWKGDVERDVILYFHKVGKE